MLKTSNLLYDVLNQLSPASRLFISQNYGNQLKEIVDIKKEKNTMENQIVKSEVVESEVVESEVVESEVVESEVVEESSGKVDVTLNERVVKPKRFINRQKTNDGTNRSASQYIRDVDDATPGLSVTEVIEMGVLLGLTIEPALVYNVRQNVKKKNGTWVANDPNAAMLTKQRRQAAAKKAREVRAAKRASNVEQIVEDDVAVGQ